MSRNCSRNFIRFPRNFRKTSGTSPGNPGNVQEITEKCPGDVLEISGLFSRFSGNVLDVSDIFAKSRVSGVHRVHRATTAEGNMEPTWSSNWSKVGPGSPLGGPGSTPRQHHLFEILLKRLLGRSWGGSGAPKINWTRSGGA